MRSSPSLSALVLVSLVLSSEAAFAQQARPKPPTATPAKPKPTPQPAAEPATSPPTAPASATPAGIADPSAIPPPAPPPWSGTTTPMSTAGTQLMPSSSSTPPLAIDVPPAAPSGQTDPTATDNRFRMLEARLAADEKVDKENAAKLTWLRGFKLSGFVQPQFLFQTFNANGSPNAGADGLPSGIGANNVIARADGTTTNSTFFRLRRARLKAEYMPTDFARFVMEIDPTPAGGPTAGVGTIARNVEGMGIARLHEDHVAEFGVGIFKVPFGYEVLQSDADRVFIERSFGEQAMFPGEYDTGARVHGSHFAKKLDVHLAVVNGVTIGEKTFAILPDLNQSKDIVGRVNYNFGPLDVGVSGYYGRGQNVDPAALKFKQFPRYAGNLEAALHHTFLPHVGETRVLGELTLAQNMDRGVKGAFAVPAIPAVIANDVQNQDERSVWIRVEQDVTTWATFGARYDFYSPDTAQKNNARDTYAFVGAVHFTKGLKLMVEFNHAIDNIHRPNAPPAAKQIETLSSVLQARF